MNGYEKLIKVIREEGSRGKQSFPVRLGTMETKEKCSAGEMELEGEELLVNEELKKKLEAGDTVLIARISETQFVIIAKVVEM